jgi:hypothetical protein
MDDEAAGAVAGADDWPVFAAFEDVGVRRERQAALPFVLAVAIGQFSARSGAISV